MEVRHYITKNGVIDLEDIQVTKRGLIDRFAVNIVDS